MADGSYKLDDPALRARLRKRIASRPTYRQRPLIIYRRNPYLIDNIAVRPSVRASTNAPAKQIMRPEAALVRQIDNTANLQPTEKSTQASRQQESPSEESITKARSRPHPRLQHVFIALAVAMILIGGYISFIGWRSNHIAQAQAAKLTQQANHGSSSAAPSTVKPSASAVANYMVAPNLPRYLIIPKLGVHARVFAVGLASGGALATPNNVFDTAWYNESAQPGQPGAMLIDGHVSSWTAHGVFYGIKTLVAGNIVKVQRGDGTVFTYKVVKSQVYKSNNVDMKAAMTPVVSGKPGLNLITCTGDVIPGTSEFNERIIVFTELV